MFNWVKGDTGRLTEAALGLASRFLGKSTQASGWQALQPLMANPFNIPKGSIVLDIETTGLKTDSPIVEAAVYDLKSGKTTRWSIKPHYLGKSVSRSELLEKYSEDWFKQRAESKFPLAGIDPAAVSPEQFLQELAGHLKGKAVWIQNAPFESRALGSLIKHHATPEQLREMRGLFETRPLSERHLANLFYVTGLETQSERARAFTTGDWSRVLRNYSSKLKVAAPGGAAMVMDIQDVSRSMLSSAQRAGLMRDLGAFTGSSMDVLGLAFFGRPAEHMAGADVRAEAPILRRTWTVAANLTEAENKGIPGLLGLLFGSHTKDDLTALKRLSTVRELLRIQAARRSLAEARLEIEILKNKEYYVTDKHDAWMAPMETYEGRATRSLVGVPRKLYPKDFNEATKMLTSERFLGKGLNFDVEKEVTAVKGLTETELKARIHLSESAEAALHKELLTRMNQASKWSWLDSLRLLEKRYPKHVAGGAIGGLLLGTAAVSFAISRTNREARYSDAYVDWSGLEDRGMRADMRKEVGFGSGFLGLDFLFGQPETAREYQAKVERFKKTIWQIPGRRAAMEADLKEREKRTQEKLGALEAEESILVQNFGLMEGLNKFSKKGMRAVQLSPDKYKYELDDADTLVLRRRGFLGYPRGKPIYIRLAGIDAPEIGHEEDPLAPVRLTSEQPYGRKAAEVFRGYVARNPNMTLVYDPTAKTYGRHIGMLFTSSGVNINLAMVQQGAAAYLPFGESGTEIIDRVLFDEAEKHAVATRRGMWKEPFWQGYKASTSVFGESITFNILNRMDKLAEDRRIDELMFRSYRSQERGYLTAEDMQQFGVIGMQLRERRSSTGSRHKAFQSHRNWGSIQ